MKLLNLKIPSRVVLEKRSLVFAVIISGILILGGGLVSYKYFRIRKDYARVVSLFYDEDDKVAPSADDTVNGRYSAQKYKDGVYQDPKLVEITESLGIHKNNIQGLEMRIVESASIGTLTDGTVPVIDPNGVFIPGYYEDTKWGDVVRAPKIEVENHLSGEELRRVVAHEFLHHMYGSWWNKDVARGYDQNLILFYVNNTSMRNKLANYKEDGILKLTEVYAFACTEYSDNALGTDLAQICGQWFDRSKLSYQH